ncbi:MAG: hypothetical protein R3E56_02965 [Burkholderiaceae bacterium]
MNDTTQQRTLWQRTLRWLLGGLLATLTLVILWLGLRVYFWATPEAPTPQRLALEERTEAANVDTDGGRLLVGLLAPADADPVAYGRCLLAAERSAWADADLHQAAPPASTDEAAKQRLDRWQAMKAERTAACLATGRTPSQPAQLAPDDRVRPGMSASQWTALASTPVAPPLRARFHELMKLERASIRVQDNRANIPETFSALLTLNQMEAARLRSRWAEGHHHATLAEWTHAMHAWTTFAGSNLMNTSVAVNALTHHLLAIHSLGRMQATTAAPEDWSALLDLTRQSEGLIDALVPAIENERMAFRALQADLVQWQATRPAWQRWLAQTLYDESATANLHASLLAESHLVAQQAALGETNLGPWEFKAWERPCPGFPVLSRQSGSWCTLLGRNGAGFTMAWASVPSLQSHGTRIADLRNLAAATRLVMEARRQGVAPGEVETDWVQRAPDGLRDVFTNAPFELDIERKVLTIVIRAPNTVLGDAQSHYELDI